MVIFSSGVSKMNCDAGTKVKSVALREQIEQLQAKALVSSASISNLILPQWQLPVYFMMIPLNCFQHVCIDVGSLFI